MTTKEKILKEEILKEFDEKFDGITDGGTYKSFYQNEVKDFLSQSLDQYLQSYKDKIKEEAYDFERKRRKKEKIETAIVNYEAGKIDGVKDYKEELVKEINEFCGRGQFEELGLKDYIIKIINK